MPEEAQSAPQAPQQKPSTGGDTKPPEPKVLFYILSFVISLFGIIFGIIYMTKEGEENKKFGKMCLILGLIPAILTCVCWLLVFVLGVGGSMFGTAVDTSTTYY